MISAALSSIGTIGTESLLVGGLPLSTGATYNLNDGVYRPSASLTGAPLTIGTAGANPLMISTALSSIGTISTAALLIGSPPLSTGAVANVNDGVYRPSASLTGAPLTIGTIGANALLISTTSSLIDTTGTTPLSSGTTLDCRGLGSRF
jgi:hypothetical protein